MNFKEMCEEVCDHIPDSKCTVGAAKTYVNRAYRQMAMSFQFYELENSDTFTTVSGTYEYDLATIASGAKDIIGLRNETDNCPMHEKAFGWWQEVNEDRTVVTGAPEYWVRFSDVILLHPTPDDAYSIKVKSRKNPTELSSDGDTPVFPEEWHYGIVLLAVSMAAIRYGYSNIAVNTKNEHLALIGSLQEEPTMQARRRVGQISVQKTRRESAPRRRHAEFD